MNAIALTSLLSSLPDEAIVVFAKSLVCHHGKQATIVSVGIYADGSQAMPGDGENEVWTGTVIFVPHKKCEGYGNESPEDFMENCHQFKPPKDRTDGD